MFTPSEHNATVEWLGATTFRLRAKGLTLFLDAWLVKPSSVPTYVSVDEIDECDYIFISHAHFDHLPGANVLAMKTGATIIANGEAIEVMRAAGVPESQLIAVAGGERVPLFTAQQRAEAMERAKVSPSAPSSGPPPGTPGPPMPNPAFAPVTVHVWPSLHCLMPPGDHRSFPETIDTGTVYTGSGSHTCTMDITRGMTYGIGGLTKLPSLPPQMPEDMKAFVTYMKDREAHRYSYFDGGQLTYNILLGVKTLLWNGHLGGYDGILKALEPKPDVALLAIAGRANLNGRPYDGSAARFATEEIKWIGEPEKVIWCLHDKGALNPKYINTRAATEMVHKETKSAVIDLKPREVFHLFGKP